MTANAVIQVLFLLAVLLILVKPVGVYMARVYEGQPCGLDIVLGPVERLIYRLCGVKVEQEMSWKSYAFALLIFNLLCIVVLFLIQIFQTHLPLNPQHLSAVDGMTAFNTAISFVTNTNWQTYSGESTMSYFSQMLGLAVQNAVSPATSMAVLVALIRAITRKESKTIGNYWVDLTRSIIYILLPIALVVSFILVSQGVIQTFHGPQKIQLVQATKYQSDDKQTHTITEQEIPLGPVASQVALVHLGTNGGGFYNANAAHPLANPTPLSNFTEMLSMILLAAAFCYTFGIMVKDKRQAWALLLAMFIIFIPMVCCEIAIEQQGNPHITTTGVRHVAKALAYSGGNMEGKETRFGITSSALWTTIATATSTGAVNSALDSYLPLSGAIPMWLMQLSEVDFGGVGSGLYGMLIFVIVAVFVAGLMVGRTPEYLGKKIEPYEMTMACIMLLEIPLTIHFGTALASVTHAGVSALGNLGPHGFSEMLYAFTSLANNNGSAFAGLNSGTSFYSVMGDYIMLIGRYWTIIPVLAIAGSLANKKLVPSSAGTMPTHTMLFVGLLISVIVIVGALTFFAALALGPIAEHLMMLGF